VDVTLGGSVPALNAINARTLSATLDVSSLGIGQHVVAVAFRAPSGTSVVSISPSRVTVTIGTSTASPTATPTSSLRPSPSPSPTGP
jgi:YbbR domain-containing protein